MDFAQKYISYALENGAADCVKFDIGQIVFDPRTYLKCLYGCPEVGRNHTCPSKPGTPSMAELERMLKHYRWGIIIHTHDKALSQKISFALEGIAYRDGHYFAFSMSRVKTIGYLSLISAYNVAADSSKDNNAWTNADNFSAR